MLEKPFGLFFLDPFLTSIFPKGFGKKIMKMLSNKSKKLPQNGKIFSPEESEAYKIWCMD